MQERCWREAFPGRVRQRAYAETDAPVELLWKTDAL